ncbi:MAG TPA: O-antigen ligase family protein [Methylomirabilota bacterium]|nr:O-antigen ligase family protein [Methylomirabilota bacterium]
MTSSRSATPPAAGSVLVLGIVLVLAAYALSQGLTTLSFGYAAGALAAVTLFGLVFIRTDFGIYVVIFSMLLSPEFSAGGAIAEGRSIVLRSEDFVLIVIGMSWLAKTAVNKEIGLVTKTPLNRPILLYVAATMLATLVGYLFETVSGLSGFFYVLKYVEYFFVYYMVVNNLRDRPHAWRMIVAAFVTAAIVALVGLAQVPSGQRVSAPFEGEGGEPNTFGGYLLFMMAIAAGIALETRRLRVRLWSVAVLGLMLVPFAFTLSRASYLGVIPTLLALTVLATNRRFMVGVLLFLLVCSPLLVFVMPAAVTNRILYTFQPEAHQPTVKLGKVGLDPSTSARFFSFKQAFEGWMSRPILGYGVTGFGFMDAQYSRSLVETGIVGLGAFLWMAWSVLKNGLHAARVLRDPEERGVAIGFVAGTIGLLVHAIGSNTFIIVRIMEPFWLAAGIVMMLPILQRDESKAEVRPAPAPVA